MRSVFLKTAVYQKTTIPYYVTLIEIITLIIITQLYIPETNLFNLTGGSAGLNEYYSQMPINQVFSENTDIQIDIPPFKTDLRTMGTMNRSNHILYPKDAPSYIIPDNEVVRWYAENTVLTDNALLWKHNGTLFKFNYETDNDQFNNPPDSDMWINPDYYLSHDTRGDCDDFSVAFASILEAKGIPARIIGLTLLNDRNHWVVQYEYNERIHYADINRNNVIIWHDENPTVKNEWVVFDKNGISKIIT